MTRSPDGKLYLGMRAVFRKCAPLSVFAERKLGFCLFLFTGDRLLNLSVCGFSEELGAVLLSTVAL